jgi:hypothetical protein
MTVDVLLTGGGVAVASAAAELRAQGFDGSVVLATELGIETTVVGAARA